MKEKWVVSAKRADFSAISQRFGIDPVTARIIRNRNVIEPEEIETYLHGTLDQISPPEQMLGCMQAVRLLQQKIKEKKKIRIIGDYDIGVTRS